MDAHIAELVGTDGASMYSGGGGVSTANVQMPSAQGSFNMGSVSDGTGWALIAAVILLVVVYAKTRGIER